jgi:hypothetical protein
MFISPSPAVAGGITGGVGVFDTGGRLVDFVFTAGSSISSILAEEAVAVVGTNATASDVF